MTDITIDLVESALRRVLDAHTRSPWHDTELAAAWPDEMRPGKKFSNFCMARLAGKAKVGVFEAYKLLVMPQHLFDAYARCRLHDKEMPDFQEAYAFTNDAEWETVGLLIILGYRPLPDGVYGRSCIWKEDLDALSRISPAA